MSVLIVVEHDNERMHSSIRNVISAALELGTKPVLLVVGDNCSKVAQHAAELPEVSAVWLVEAECFRYQLAENMSQIIAHLADSFTYILSAANTFGKNVLPRVAALLDVAQVSDVTSIISKNTVEHVIFAGNVLETVELLDVKKVMTIRPTAFNPVLGVSKPCSIDTISKTFIDTKSSFVSHQLNAMVRPDLSSAKIIVSGGRGLHSAEQFKLIDELADELGAAVGASRAAVDAGFVSNDYQVGQTGKIVAPEIYFAIGISGAIQHLAGMKDSKIIVAINKDTDAPIFQVANYGLVGDLFTLVPELIALIKSRKGAKA